MKSSVIIKGNKYGFQIVLNPTLPFEELLREVGNKFKESTHLNRLQSVLQDVSSRQENRIFWLIQYLKTAD